MKSNNIKNFFKSKLEMQPAVFCKFSIGLAALLFLARVLFEFIFIWLKASSVHITFMTVFETLLLDFLYILYISFFAGVFFFLLSLINARAASIFYYSISVFLITGYLMLQVYFSVSAVPLGSDLFGYSLQEITHTIGAAGGISVFQILGFIILVTITIIILKYSSKLPLNKNIPGIMLFLCICSFIFYHDLAPASSSYASQTEYYLTVNKLDFFFTKTFEYFFDEDDEYYKADYYFDSGGKDDLSFKYINSNYPFLHEENSKDVLSPFFNESNVKPSFVFIIVESLGRGYSGKGAYLGSYTPFLDSLADASLYWENILSGGGRTFAAFPSIFGSLPFAGKGFLDLGNSMPQHFSLIKLLKDNGYTANFFHGGDARFDNMDIFLKKNKIDYILSENNFGPGYSKMPSNGGGFSWGYGDKELFTKSFDVIKNNYNPQINIFLSLSTHSPFLVANQDYYKSLFDKIYSRVGISEDVKKEVAEYRNILSTVLYMDDAIRYFFNAYKKRSDYNNTIFIITGDHRMPEIPITTQIDRFHVPLIIFSPMLKRTARFSSVSSHFDILPSLMAFLKNHYKMSVPAASVFMGSGLDTVRLFRNIHSYPLMRNKNELLDYVDKEYFLSDGTLYRIEPDLNISKISDEAKQNNINDLFDEFKNRNNTLINKKILQP